jgi:hypothetical protein
MRLRELGQQASAKRTTTTIDTRSALMEGIAQRGEIS